jgi:hybrid cluster-associated redox disulfide protein
MVKQKIANFINKDDLISDIALKYPRAVELLTEYGLFCASCFLSQFETVEMGAQVHGMTEKELETMIKEINGQLKKEKIRKKR